MTKKLKVSSKNTKLSSNNQHTCEWCKKTFIRENSLISHMCEDKRRWLNKDDRHVKLAHYAYIQFYRLNYSSSKKDPDYKQFCESRYYTGFVKFGRYLIQINALYPEQYIVFLIKTGVKLKDWTNDKVYSLYIRELGRKESAEEALSRNIMLMEQWARETNNHWTDFFRLISPELATHWIQLGRISPWLLYRAPSSNDLFSRMSDEQLGLIQEALDPTFWKSKFKTNKEDALWVEEQCIDVGL